MNILEDQYNPTGYCVICKGTAELKIIHKIYTDLGMSISYSDLLMKCFYIQFLDTHHGKDNMLCTKCIEKTKFCVNFRKQVEAAHQLLYDLKPILTNNSISKKRSKKKSVTKTKKEYHNQTLFKIKDEPFFDDSDDEPVVKFKSQPLHNDDYFMDDIDIDKYSDNSDSDSSVKTEEILRATGYYSMIQRSKERNRYSIPKLDPGQTKCPECDKEFPEHCLLKRHHPQHFPLWICEVCGLTFTQHLFFMKHTKSHSVQKFPCDLCDKKYNTLDAMNRHRQINHFNFLPFVCFHCNKRFKYGTLKKKHLLEEHGVKCKMYKCPKCELEFFTVHYMESHLKKHHFKLKEHQCCACSTAFYSERDLNKHYLVKHEGIKNHKCEICNKVFSYSRGLRTHRKIHLNQKDQVCQLCGKAFIQQTSLKYHIRTHHKEYNE